MNTHLPHKFWRAGMKVRCVSHKSNLVQFLNEMREATPIGYIRTIVVVEYDEIYHYVAIALDGGNGFWYDSNAFELVCEDWR